MTEIKEPPRCPADRLKGWTGGAGGHVRWAVIAILADTFAAIGFALAFATAIASLADGQGALRPIAAAGLALALRGVFGWLRARSSESAGQTLVAAARTDLAAAAARAGPGLFDGAPAGERVAQLVDRTALLSGHAAQWLPGRMAAVITPICVVVAIFFQSWLAGTLILVSTIMLPVFIWLTASETAALARAQQASLDALSGVFESRVRLAGTIRAFNGVTREARGDRGRRR